MDSVSQLQKAFKDLRLVEIAETLPQLLRQAEQTSWTYLEMLTYLTNYELQRRDEKRIQRMLKWAQFPYYLPIDNYDLSVQSTLSQRQFKQLCQLNWINDRYNLIFLGPPGVGKTALSICLGIEAINQGYKAMFITMGTLMHYLKTEEFSRKSQVQLQRIRDASLVIIDDLMYMAMDTHEGNLLFEFINYLYERSAIILTSNKEPQQWGSLVEDQGTMTAILDRLLHRSEIIVMEGESYRMRHKKRLFS